MPGEDVLERLAIRRAGIGQRLVDVVTEDLLEAPWLELIAAQLPIGLGTLRVRVRVVASLDEQFVVELVQPTTPARVSLERLTGALIVVDDVDVPVDVLALGVVVDDDQVLGAVGSLGESNAEIEHLLEVVRVLNVEDLRVASKHQVVGLVPTAVGSGLRLGIGDELIRRPHRARVGSRPVGTALPVLHVLPTTTVERVHDPASGRDAACDGHRRAHVLVRSPRSARRAVTAARVRTSRSSSTTTVTVSPVLRAVAASRRNPLRVTPSRRSCSTSAAETAVGRGRAAARSMSATSARRSSSASRTTARTQAVGLTPRA